MSYNLVQGAPQQAYVQPQGRSYYGQNAESIQASRPQEPTHSISFTGSGSRDVFYRQVIKQLLEALGGDIKEIEKMFSVQAFDNPRDLVNAIGSKGFLSEDEVSSLLHLHGDSSLSALANGYRAVVPGGSYPSYGQSNYGKQETGGLRQGVQSAHIGAPVTVSAVLMRIENHLTPEVASALRGCELFSSPQFLDLLERQARLNDYRIDELKFLDIARETQSKDASYLAQRLADNSESQRSLAENRKKQLDAVSEQLRNTIFDTQQKLDRTVKLTDTVMYTLDKLAPQVMFNGNNLEQILLFCANRIEWLENDIKQAANIKDQLERELLSTKIRVTQESQRVSDKLIEETEREVKLLGLMNRIRNSFDLPQSHVRIGKDDSRIELAELESEATSIEEIARRYKELARGAQPVRVQNQDFNESVVSNTNEVIDLRNRVKELERVISLSREKIQNLDGYSQQLTTTNKQYETSSKNDQATIEKLRAALSQAENIVKSSSEAANQGTNQLQLAVSKIQEYEHQLNDVKQLTDRYQSRIKELEDSLQQASSAYQMLQNQMGHATEQIQQAMKLQADFNQLQNQYGQANTFIAQIKGENSRIIEQFKVAESGYQAQINKLSQDLNTAGGQYKQLQDSLGELQGQLSSQSETLKNSVDNSEFMRRIGEKDKAISELQSRLSFTESQVELFQQKISSLGNEGQSYKNNLDLAGAKIKELESLLESAKQQSGDREKQLMTREQNLAQREQKNLATEQSYAQYEQGLVAREQTLAQKEQHIVNGFQALEHQTHQLEQQGRQLDEWRVNLDAFQLQTAQMRAEVEKALAQANQQGSEVVQTLRLENDKLRIEVTAARSENLGLTNEKKMALQAYQDEQKKFSTLEARYKELEKTYYELQFAHSQINEQLAKSKVDSDLLVKLQQATQENHKLIEYSQRLEDQNQKLHTTHAEELKRVSTQVGQLNLRAAEAETFKAQRDQLQTELTHLQQTRKEHPATTGSQIHHSGNAQHIAASNAEIEELKAQLENIALQNQELNDQLIEAAKMVEENDTMRTKLENMQQDNEMMAQALEEINDKIEKGLIILVDVAAEEEELDSSENQVRIDEEKGNGAKASDNVDGSVDIGLSNVAAGNLQTSDILNVTRKELKNLKNAYDELKVEFDESQKMNDNLHRENEDLKDELLKIVGEQEGGFEEMGEEHQNADGEEEGRQEGDAENENDERTNEDIIQENESMIEILKELSEQLGELKGAYTDVINELFNKIKQREERGLNYKDFVESAEEVQEKVKQTQHERGADNMRDFNRGLQESVEFYESEKDRLIRRIQKIETWCREDDAAIGQSTEREDGEAQEEGLREGEEEGDTEQADGQGEEGQLSVDKLVELLLITLQLIETIRETASTEEATMEERLASIIDSINRFEQMGDSGEGNFELASILQKIVDNKVQDAQEGAEENEGVEEANTGAGQDGQEENEGDQEGQEEQVIDYDTLRDELERVCQLLEEKQREVSDCNIRTSF